MCLFSLLWAVVEMIAATLDRYSALEIVWVRYGTHILFMLAAFAPRYGLILVRTRRPGIQVFRGIMMIGMTVFAMIGFRALRAADVWAVINFSPLFVMLLSILVLREPALLRRWVTVFVAFAGMLIVSRPGSGELGPAFLLPLASAFCFGLYQIMTRILRTESRLTNLFYTAIVVFLPLTLLQPKIWIMPTLKDGLLMVTMGLVGFILLWALDFAYQLAPASVLAPYAFLVPIWMSLAHFGIQGHRPDGLTLLGAAIVIGSCFYLFIRESRGISLLKT